LSGRLTSFIRAIASERAAPYILENRNLVSVQRLLVAPFNLRY
jgi:hypothetical protein